MNNQIWSVCTVVTNDRLIKTLTFIDYIWLSRCFCSADSGSEHVFLYMWDIPYSASLWADLVEVGFDYILKPAWENKITTMTKIKLCFWIKPKGNFTNTISRTERESATCKSTSWDNPVDLNIWNTPWICTLIEIKLFCSLFVVYVLYAVYWTYFIGLY